MDTSDDFHLFLRHFSTFKTSGRESRESELGRNDRILFVDLLDRDGQNKATQVKSIIRQAFTVRFHISLFLLGYLHLILEHIR